ncbi:hypothetical protein GUITHDRAFT_150582 [Guillardia theta CCMP2712]|uniref:AB hydrolase-1 domain-containing protein n=1 Tax=Guillardia theta (strain CCMP2712) TaxID=905079 RepID=L1JVY6_GUITC|nr:hypothetical protein GUITHDRAFT_150582 [Guillardia theta CCMP2712]EKX52547.1 hypothetical protein GUITHDRAFT_150582 [Guillardia theta CCMP2712]|eukprot:XP_005839527.1 hypothetical protein GUITHDRAFT_150582 [Guillardia theta CCMP2712]
MGLPGTHFTVILILSSCFIPILRSKNVLVRIFASLVFVWAFICPFLTPLVIPLHTQEDEVHFISCPDGWRINLARYRPVGSYAGERKQSTTAPVILCHGAFANRVTYDLGEGYPSLATYLAEKGHDVWVLELRGHGRSHTKPGWLYTTLSQGMNEGGSWSIMKYIEVDLPAAVQYVRNHTGAKKVHWVGHSMGGIILYSWLGLAMGNTQDFASIVTLGSALDHSMERQNDIDKGVEPGNMNSTYHVLYVPRSLRSPGMAPFGWACALLAPLGGTFLDLFLGFQYSPSSIRRDIARRLLAHNFEAEPWQVVFEIHTVFSKKYGMLHPVTKEPLLPLLNHSLPVPLLAFAGACDHQFTPDAVKRTAYHLAALDDQQHVKMIVPGEGTEVCYGHYDMLIGPRAEEHVFAPLENWLNEVDEGQHWYSQDDLQVTCTIEMPHVVIT